MIIACPNCNKKFKIDEKLIPENGRLLQCSSCNHKWYFSIKNNNSPSEDLTYLNKNDLVDEDIKEKLINPSLSETISDEDNEKIFKKKSKIQENKIKNNNINKRILNKNYSSENILSNLMIIIISLFALILILDTFKDFIANYFPMIIPILNNLYETFSDMRFFIKDLVR